MVLIPKVDLRKLPRRQQWLVSNFAKSVAIKMIILHNHNLISDYHENWANCKKKKTLIARTAPHIKIMCVGVLRKSFHSLLPTSMFVNSPK